MTVRMHRMSLTLENIEHNKNKILIVGGYGRVGQLIAARLAPHFPRQVIIAGRNFSTAQNVADELGYGIEARTADVSTDEMTDILDGVRLVLVCLDQTDTNFVEQCISRHICYIDISADYTFISKVEKLNHSAKVSGATVVLSVGVAPGLTNLLAKRAKEQMGYIERLDIVLEFGGGDHHGQAALNWMFNNLDAEYEVYEHGMARTVRSFRESIRIQIPNQPNKKLAYRFNFSDQYVIRQTLNIPNVSTWLRFDETIMTCLLAKATQAGVSKLFQLLWFRTIVMWLFMNIQMGSEVCGITVQAKGEATNGTKILTLSLTGQREALMTAIVATETARQILIQPSPSGVYHIEQVIAFSPIILALQAELPDLVLVD